MIGLVSVLCYSQPLIPSSVEQPWSTLCNYSTVQLNSQGQYVLQCGRNTSGVAWGKFRDDSDSDGWGKLYVHSNAKSPDLHQMTAAGFLEGALTSTRISQHYTNFMSYRFPDGIDERLRSFSARHWKWLRKYTAEQVQKGGEESWYWHHIELLLAQLDGLMEG